MEEHSRKLISGIIGIIVGVFILTTGMDRMEQAKALEEKLVPVEATITSIERAASAKTSSNTYFMRLSYTYNGQKYDSSMYTGFYEDPGKTTEIWIDPGIPTVCMNQSGLSPVNYVLIVAGALLAILMLVRTGKEIIAIRRES